jgi:RNA polymerase-binding transcription factor DksA
MPDTGSNILDFKAQLLALRAELHAIQASSAADSKPVNCAICNDEIGSRRLRVDPTLTRCIKCTHN